MHERLLNRLSLTRWIAPRVPGCTSVCVRVCALDLNFGPRALHYVPPRIVRHPTLHRRLCSPARRLHNAIAMHGDTFTVCDTGSKTQSWQR